MKTLQEPLQLKPVMLPKRWGNTALLEKAGLLQPESHAQRAANIGEIWLVSDVENFETQAQSQEFEGSLSQLMAQHATELFGSEQWQGEKFPLILKVLSAGSLLSCQVHPDAASAQKLGVADRGKHEAWWIYEVEDSAQIYRGMKQATKQDVVRDHILNHSFQDLLVKHQPQAGQIYDIPPGTYHGCGNGLVMFEVQERCPVTFRVYDWGRPNTELHIDNALAVGRFSPDGFNPETTTGSTNSVQALENAPFDMEIHRLAAGSSLSVGTRSELEIMVFIDGHLSSPNRTLRSLTTLLWPARAAAEKFVAEAQTTVLIARPKSPL